MNDVMHKSFALDCPRHAFTWMEDSKSCDMFLSNGIRICVIGMESKSIEVRSTQNAVRLWCTRYGNTIIGKIVATVHVDEDQVWDKLNSLKFKEPKPVVAKAAKSVNPVVSREDYQALMTIVESVEAEEVIEMLRDDLNFKQAMS